MYEEFFIVKGKRYLNKTYGKIIQFKLQLVCYKENINNLI